MASDPARREDAVNNEFYASLGERWYSAMDDPVALLRAEAAARNPWIVQELRQEFRTRRARVLDIGCGAGFLSNELARAGFQVDGLDRSPETLEVARRHDPTGTVRYDRGDAGLLPYPGGSFDAVCAMDFLEHVEDPARIVSEASRVLSPGGLFFFHTFNRNPLAWLFAAKGLEWFVRNTPRNMHVYRLFIRPEELRSMCADSGLRTVRSLGLRPKLVSSAFLRLLLTGAPPPDFKFVIGGPRLIGYMGYARKED